MYFCRRFANTASLGDALTPTWKQETFIRTDRGCDVSHCGKFFKLPKQLAVHSGKLLLFFAALQVFHSFILYEPFWFV